MSHSIELLLDRHSDVAVRAQWRALADAGLPSQLRIKADTNRPHITLLAAQQISPDVDETLRALAPHFPLPCVLGTPLVFGGPRVTLARLVVPSSALLALHAEVYRLTMAHLPGGPYGHCEPGHWTPHVTLGRRYTAEEVGRALTALSCYGDLPARVVGLRRWDGDARIDHLLVG
jgi:2'-5' RNA ligase